MSKVLREEGHGTRNPGKGWGRVVVGRRTAQGAAAVSGAPIDSIVQRVWATVTSSLSLLIKDPQQARLVQYTDCLHVGSPGLAPWNLPAFPRALKHKALDQGQDSYRHDPGSPLLGQERGSK